MIPLKQLQHLFMDTLFNQPDNVAIAQLEAQLSDNKQLTAREQIAIYRNSVIGAMISALRQTYPVCNKLVGDRFFEGMATQFIRDNPSLSPDLGDYGETFADFIANFEPASKLIYLADVARLEWAYERGFCAVDHHGLDLQAFSQLSEQQQSEVHFHLPPGSSLLTSAYPIAQIWQTNQEDNRNDNNVSLSQSGDKLLVWRQHFDMRIDALEDDQWHFLCAVQQNQAFIDICERFADNSAVAVEALLPICVQQGWIADFSLPS